MTLDGMVMRHDGLHDLKKVILRIPSVYHNRKASAHSSLKLLSEDPPLKFGVRLE